jgi:hypothetical protein
MNTEKRLRGRPHKKEEDKLIGRRISMIQANWDLIDEFIEERDMSLSELFQYISLAIEVATSGGETHEN